MPRRSAKKQQVPSATPAQVEGDIAEGQRRIESAPQLYICFIIVGYEGDVMSCEKLFFSTRYSTTDPVRWNAYSNEEKKTLLDTWGQEHIDMLSTKDNVEGKQIGKDGYTLKPYSSYTFKVVTHTATALPCLAPPEFLHKNFAPFIFVTRQAFARAIEMVKEAQENNNVI